MTQTTALRRFVLNDDEAVALATRAGGVWRSALVTVDVADLVAVAAAAARGTRQLARHGVLSAGSDGPSVDPALRSLVPLLCEEPELIAYVAPSHDPTVLAAGELCVFPGPSPDERVVDVVSGFGRHELVVLPARAATDLVVAVARAELEREDGREDLALHVTRTIAAGARVVVVSAGHAVEGRFSQPPVRVVVEHALGAVTPDVIASLARS